MKRVLSLLFVILFIFTPTAFAQSDGTIATEEAQMEQQSEYVLPYPGLLPDNPLYFLKTARDNIIGYLISDPLKKAEFNLLQADKRLQAGVYLLQRNKDKIELAHTTISKGQNYFHQALEKTKDAQKQGVNASNMLAKLKAAAQKHEEVLTELEKPLTGESKKRVRALKETMVDLEKQVEQVASN
jgi:hypothetical protein